ncbi:MAG: MBL fold metallo-hydrolase [Anaerovoracaceae bacterium]
MKIKRLIGGNLESNGYIIYDRDMGSCYIVDPGYEPKRYIRELEQMDLQVLGILLTHHHYDHVGAVDAIVQRFDCAVYLHREDCDQYGKPVDMVMEHGQTILLGDEVIQVIHSPGHTRGSVCFYSEKSKLAFTGDTIFNVDLGRTDLADGSPNQMEKSIRDVISKWGNDITIYPGHGDPATMKYVRKHNQEYSDILK